MADQSGDGIKKYTSHADEQKGFWLSSFSIDNRITVLLITVLIAVIGIRSYLSIPKEAQPDITIPTVMVITTYPGVSPEDMESLITRPLEDEIGNISDIKEMNSTSSEGYSNITVEFTTDMDMNKALQEVREKVDLGKNELPQDVEDPIIQEINFSEFPIMQVNVSGRYGMDQLKQIGEDLQDQMESIPSVLEVDMAGGVEREVKVNIDLPKLKYYGLTFSDVVAAIEQENVTVPGGTIDVGSKQFLLRVPGEYKTPEPIRDIVVDAPDDNPIYLRDIAEVQFGFKERESYARLEGDPVITLSVKKRSGENIIETSNAVKTIVDEELPNLPPTTNIEVTSDQSKEIDSMVSSLENNIISGLLLVIGVLLFFLGIRNASFVGIAIPLSMFLSFIILASLDITMNMVVLFSLILALGMLVDNSIVVVENIYRYLEEGFDRFESARKGTGEVAVPIISGTLTTLGAFFPLVFWPGIVGEFMAYLPITLIVTLGSSLFVALVINPVLCALFMRLDQENDENQQFTKQGKRLLKGIGIVILLLLLLNSALTWGMLITLGIVLVFSYRLILRPIGDWWQQRGYKRLLIEYEDVLRWSLNHGKTILGISVVVLLLSFLVFYYFNNGLVFFPEDIPPRDAYVQVEAPVGTNVEFTRQIITEMEERVPGISNKEDISTVLSTSGSAISGGLDMGQGSQPNRGTVVVNFKDYQQREGSTFDAIEYMRTHFPRGIAGADITVEKPQSGPPTGKPINLELSGKSMKELERLSEKALRILENDPVYSKLEGLDSNLPESRPELEVTVDRQKTGLYGLSTQEVGNTIRSAVNGVEASQYRDGKNEYDITVRLSEVYRNDLSMLGNLKIMGEEGRQIPLSAVADWQINEGFGGIKHKDRERVVTVSADVRSNYQANAVLKEVQGVLAPFLSEMSQGYSHGWTGQQEEQDKARDFLTTAFLIALSLISLILISQFNSLSKPVMVLTSVIMSVSGVLYGLVIFQMPFSIIMTGVGIVSLAGVVVNNAIVLIDYIDILRTRDQLPLFEALVEGGKVRLRPVLLTAITTTLGLVPLAIGFNLDFIVLVNQPLEFFTHLGEYVYMGGEQAAWWGPMAIAVISGLIFATALTLILVPVLYYLMEKGRRNTNKYLFGEQEPAIIKKQPITNGGNAGEETASEYS